MEWMAEIFAVGAILIGLTVVARFNMAILFNTGDLTRVLAALGAMIAGAFVGRSLFNSVAGQTDNLVFSCQSMASIEFFYNCGGWPVLGEDAKIFVDKLFQATTNLAMITPIFAACVGAIYLQRQLISQLDFDWKDAARIFLSGFMLMISVLFLPKIAMTLSEVLLSAGSYSGLIKQGQENLSDLTKLIAYTSEEVARSEESNIFTSLNVIFLRIGVFSLSSVINYIGPGFILAQAVIFVGAPVALLSAALTERDPKEQSLIIGLKYAKFMLVQVLYWTLFTLAPKVENPESLDSLTFGLAGQAFGLAAIVLLASLGLLFASVKYLTIPILFSTIRKVS